MSKAIFLSGALLLGVALTLSTSSVYAQRGGGRGGDGRGGDGARAAPSSGAARDGNRSLSAPAARSPQAAVQSDQRAPRAQAMDRRDGDWQRSGDWRRDNWSRRDWDRYHGGWYGGWYPGWGGWGLGLGWGGYPGWGYSGWGGYPGWGYSRWGYPGGAYSGWGDYYGYSPGYYGYDDGAYGYQDGYSDGSYAATTPQMPPSPPAPQWFTDATTQFERGNYREAQQAAERGVSEMPQDPRSHELLSLAFFAQGDYGHAAEHAKQALTLGPPADWETLYHYYNSLPTYTRQLDDLANFLNKNPNSADARFVLGYHDLMMGHRAEAREQFAWITQHQPQDQVARRVLDQIDRAPSTAATPTPVY